VTTTHLQAVCALFPDRVERVDLDKQGQLLVRTIEGDWYRMNGDEPSPCAPHLDPALPVAATLEPGSYEVLAYRPGRRIVFHTTSQPDVIHKGYRARRSGAAAVRLSTAQRILRSGSFAPPHLVAADQDHDVLSFERAAGESLTIRTEDSDSFHALGVGLRQLQSRVKEGEALESFSAMDEVDVLARLESRLERLTELPEGARELSASLSRLAKDLPEPRYVPTHRDLHDGQFLRAEDRVTLLDFDLFCRADEALDVANLLCHLALRAMQGTRLASESSALACGDALLEGWNPGSSEERWVRLRFYQATTFARLALVYSLRPRWSHLAGDLVTLAEKCRGETALAP